MWSEPPDRRLRQACIPQLHTGRVLLSSVQRKYMSMLQGLDKLFAQSPARRLLGPEHADAIAAAERRSGGGGSDLVTPVARGGQREEPVPLPTARKMVRTVTVCLLACLGIRV